MSFPMKKRMISFVLVFAMVLSMLPMSAMAALANRSTDASEPYIEVKTDKDGEKITVKPHNAPEGSAVYFAYYNADGRMLDIEIWPVDGNSHKFAANEDAKYAKVFLLDKNTGGPLTPAEKVLLNTETYKVTFYDGSRVIETMEAEEGEPLGAVPGVEKSSKANAFLVGYFTNPECTQPFYAENPVTSDMKVYAKYEDMGTGETLNFTSFAQMDQQPNISFEISGSGDPAQAVTLEVMDGSDPVELKFEATNDGYIVSAVGGFNEGCSYQLHLADGWCFKDKDDTIRTASFSIYKEQVENLRMNDDIVYVKDTDAIDYLVGGQSYDMLTSELITEQGGSFNYSDAAIDVGDIICIYTGTHPEQRGMDGDVLDPALYVKAKAVRGSTITFEPLGEDDYLKLYNVPDNFPIQVDVLPTEETGTVNISALDADLYADMMGEDYDLNMAKSHIEVGDFISMYVSYDGIQSEADICFGEVTAYDAATGEITYQQTTQQAILESMDLYRDIEITGDDLVTEEQKAEIVATLQAQIEESGFAEDAAFILADMIAKTDGFNNPNLESLLITDSNGNALAPEELQLMNIGGQFELTDKIKPTVELITEGDQLHYEKGTQLAVGIKAEFEVELEDEEKIVIELNATFVQEVEINPRVKGYVIPYFFGWLPIPVGAKASGTIDIKSFTGFSFEAEIYTVGPEEEDKDLWEQFQELAKDPRKLAELPGLPDELSKGLNTVGDVFDKIEEIEDNMAKIKEKAEELEEKKEQYEGYAEDLETIWAYVEENGLTTKEDWKGMCEALDKTSITSDLLDMMGMTNETGLKTEYYESMEALMERYCEMVEKETDWVELFNEDICKPEFFVYGLSIAVDVDFVASMDLSLAIGSNMQYEVGKRFEFWFELAPFYKNGGCTQMDLLDESFAFQFYVMGRLGLRAGIDLTLQAGIGSCHLANIGVSIELGPYMKFWGFFVYEYEKFRAANTTEWLSDERMAGAVLLEFGLYMKISFAAEALDHFEYEYDFMDEEFPLLTIGEEKFYYQPNYIPAEDEILQVKDRNNNSQDGITMQLPDHMIALDYVDLREGVMAIDYLDYDRFHYTVSNPNFSIDRETGEISVNVPDDTRYMECDLTITYKYGKLAFSTYDMSITIPLVWTNLSTEELSEYYTAAVRVGNDEDGYTTVWSQRVLKNKVFDLPTADEIKELIGWNDYKYDMGDGYGSQKLEGLTLIEDKVYDFDIDYKTYSVRVANVETDSGMTETRTYFARFGEEFDFSDLASTGTNANGAYTKFAELTHSIVGLDLANAIDSDMAAILANSVTAYAKYIDNSVTATFMFTGIDAENIVMTLRRGDEPDLTQIQKIVEDAGMAIKDITPVIAPITASTMYQVICGELDTEPATITFEENGGSEVADITKPYGSLIGNLPTPEKAGSTFAGWYADKDLTEPFTLTKVPQGGATAYAKWTANEYTVTFRVNGGNELENNKLTVTNGQAYGALPKPSRSGYGFAGWFTAATGGDQITAESIYSIAGNQTLYAQWRELVVISEDIFDFGATEEYTYERTAWDVDPTAHEPDFTLTVPEGETYTQGDFTIRYIAQGYESDGYVDAPAEAGTWNALVTRPADNTYAKFEKLYENVLIIHKAQRTNYATYVAGDANLTYYPDGETYSSYSYVGVRLVHGLEGDGWISDADPDLKIRFSALPHDTTDKTAIISSSEIMDYPNADSQDSSVAYIYNLPGGTQFDILVELIGDRNYEDVSFIGFDVADSSRYPYLGYPIATKATRYDVYYRDDTHNPGEPDVRITDDYGYYHDELKPKFDWEALRAEGFTKLEITFQFEAKEINDGYQDLKLETYHDYSSRDFDCSGDSYDRYSIAEAEFESSSGWKTHGRTIILDLNADYHDDNYRFLVGYDAHGSGEDDWYLGDTHYTVTVKK